MSEQDFTASIEIRQIPEFPGFGVSLLGCQAAVWSCWDWRKRETTSVWRPLCTWIDRSGHVQVEVRKNGRRFRTGVHRLVLMAFVGPCPDGMEACHENDRGTDNRLRNLRWDTSKNNKKDKFRNGKGNKGAKNGLAKLDDDKVREIRELIKKGLSQREIASRYGIQPAQISSINRRLTWAHVQ